MRTRARDIRYWVRLAVFGAASAVFAANSFASVMPSQANAAPHRALFTQLRWGCFAPDFVAFEGEDDWTTNKMTREKLVVITWQNGLRTMTNLFDRNSDFDGIRCGRGRVELLVAGPGSIYSTHSFRVGTDIKALPIEDSHISSGYGEPESFAGLGVGHGYMSKKYSENSIFALGVPESRDAPTLLIEKTGSVEVGSGYTSTERVRVSVGGKKPASMIIENGENFEAAD